MSIESIQSQIEALRQKKINLKGKSSQTDYGTIINSLEEVAVSTAKELDKAQAEIEAERQSYQNLFLFTQEGYFVTDAQAIICEVNAVGSTLLGAAEGDLMGTALDAHVRATERDLFRSHISNLDHSKNFDQWETIFVHDSKKERKVSLAVSVISDYQHNVTGLRWLVRDITQHQEIKEQLRRNTGRLSEAQQIGHVGSWEWNIKKDEVLWSDEMYRIYGLEPQSVRITYEGFLALVHPEDQGRVRAAIEKSFQTCEPFSFDHCILRPDGVVRYLYAQGMTLLDDAGEVTQMFGTSRDVTEQKQVEELLKRVNLELEDRVEKRTQELSDVNARLKRIVVERAHHQSAIQELNRELNRRVAELQTVFSVLPIGITVAYDPEAIYTTTNATGQQILGVSRSEITPSADYGVADYKVTRDHMELPWHERPLPLAMALNVTVRDSELDLEYPNGKRLNLLTYASPLYDEINQVRGGVLAFIDITKRRIVEKRLALQYTVADALAESNSLKEASLKVLEIICKDMNWEMGVFWNFDHDTNNLYVENIWQQTEMTGKEMAEASRKLFLAPGEALSGMVYLSNQPLWLTDFSNQSHFLREEMARKDGFTGLVSFPLRRGEGEVLGVIEFFSATIQPASPDLIEMFNAFASQIGEFMGRTHAEDLRAAQVKLQIVITELSQQALLSSDIQKFLDDACVQIAQTLSVDFTHVLALAPEQQQMVFRAGAGWQEDMTRLSLDLVIDSQPLYVLSDTRPIKISELSKETRFYPAPFLVENEIVSGMSVGIPGPAQVFGLLEAYSTSRRNFSADEMHFLYGAAQVLAAAIQRHDVEEALRLSRNQMAVILSGIMDGITVLNTKGKMVYANHAAAKMLGYANTDELLNTPVKLITPKFEIYDESGGPMNMNELPTRLALAGQHAQQTVVRFKIVETGEERWSMVNAQAVRNEKGQVEMAVSIFHDITDLKRSEMAQRLLAETSILLATDLSYESRMSNLTKLLVPSLGDWCAIDILDEDGELQRMAVMHMDPQMLEWAYEVHNRFPPDRSGRNGSYKVIRTNQSEYHPIILKETIDAIPNPEQRELFQKLGLSSLLVIPLFARGRTFGTLSLVWAESNYHYSLEDLTLAEELGRRAALALDNARLYEASQRLNAELEDRVNKRTDELQGMNAHLLEEIKDRKLVEEQFRQLNVELEERVGERTGELKQTNQELEREIFERQLVQEALQASLQKTRELYEVSQTMGLVNTPDELLETLLSSSYLKFAMRASVAIFDKIWEKDEAAPTSCTILTAWNKKPETLLHIGQEMTILEYGWLEPYSRNEPLILQDIRISENISEVMRQWLTDVGVVSSVIFPLLAVGNWYGLLSLHFNDVLEMAADDVRHLQGLVDEVAMGVYNFRLLEAEARARREAEEANNLKLKFLAMVSHELRTPLTSIKGFSTTLLADDVEWNAENQRDFIETISTEADKLTELIEQLLNVSRLEAGTIRINPHRVEWNQILLTSMPQLNAITANHQLVIAATDAGFPPLYVDVMRISQVVTNLVTNAVRYSEPNTTITVMTERLSDEFIKVRVTDEGVGIPPEARNRVFEAFQQLDREKGGTQGAGLGLAICQGLIEAHGGRIWVDDEHDGSGTTISFTLPIAQ